MKQFKRKYARGLGFSTFVALAWLSTSLAGPVVCADGWPSLSIGRQGACSWHGGVGADPRLLLVLASAAAGVWVWQRLKCGRPVLPGRTGGSA